MMMQNFNLKNKEKVICSCMAATKMGTLCVSVLINKKFQYKHRNINARNTYDTITIILLLLLNKCEPEFF